MSGRNRYDDANGVCRMRWNRGAPSEGSDRPVLVEVWRSETNLWYEANKPRVAVVASLEMWVRQDGQWMAIGWGGKLRPAEEGEVRRHSYTYSRRWESTIALDGWDS